MTEPRFKSGDRVAVISDEPITWGVVSYDLTHCDEHPECRLYRVRLTRGYLFDGLRRPMRELHEAQQQPKPLQLDLCETVLQLANEPPDDD